MKYSNEEILHSKFNEIEILQFKKLLKYEKDINHFFTLKHGGVSNENFKSLNLGMFTNDEVNDVRNNYLKVCKTFDIDIKKIFIQKQEHTNIVSNINEENCSSFYKEEYFVSDGSITDLNEVCLVSNCADCMTILLYDPVNKVIGSIHAGWQGVLNDILFNAINKMKAEYNSKTDDIIVCVGPSICEDCFEVRDDVANKFKDKFGSMYINVKDDEKFTINLFNILKDRLLNVGVNVDNIVNANICTKCNSDDFYSYRVSKETGRMGNFIIKR